MIKKPDRLQPNDKVAILSPSWGGPSVFPKIYELGLKNLKNVFQLEPIEFPTARMDANITYLNPKIRAKDINDAFSDPDIKAIITTIGGDDSIRILPYLDKQIIQKNPKIVMGFSDTAILLTFCNKCGLVTYNGPSIMAGFAQMDNLPIEFKKHIQEILFEAPEKYSYQPYSHWADGYPDWKDDENIGKMNELQKNAGWNWLQGTGKVTGKLFGGCIEVLDFLKGTDYWFEPKFWDNKILFLETSEEKPSVDYVKYQLRNYGMQGIFDRLSGLMFGRARDYTQEEKLKLNEIIKQVVSVEFGNTELSIVTNLDFGHTDPQWILPLGIETEIDYQQKRISLIESPLK